MGRGNGEILVKGYKLPVIRLTGSGDLMCSLLIIANNTEIHLKFATRVNLKCSHYRNERVIM